MPETAVDEDHLPARGEHQIGFAGQFRAVEAVAVAHGVDQGPDPHLGGAALALDAGHAFAALGRG